MSGKIVDIEVGTVGRAHGLDGSFYLRHAVAHLLEVGVPLKFGAEQIAPITRFAGTDANPIIRLEGIDTREQAEALRGMKLSTEVEEAELGEGEYWARELEGCKVVDGNTVVGVVERLLRFPSCEVLAVKRSEADQSQLLVPMVKDAIRAIDIDAKRIEIDTHFLGESTPEVSDE